MINCRNVVPKPLWSFQKLVIATLCPRGRLVHILISSRKGGVQFQSSCWPSLFPRHCQGLFKLSLSYTHGEFFPHKPGSVTQHSLDKLVSLWFGWAVLICISFLIHSSLLSLGWCAQDKSDSRKILSEGNLSSHLKNVNSNKREITLTFMELESVSLYMFLRLCFEIIVESYRQIAWC